MSKKIKIFVYWTSVVLPIYDIVCGTIQGIRSCFRQAKQEIEAAKKEQKLKIMKGKFENDDK